MHAAVVCCPMHSSQPGFLVLHCIEVPVDAHAMLCAACCPQTHDHQGRRGCRAGHLKVAAVVDSLWHCLCRPSKVPDHVKNPSRYTCYVLDEPITVGSGDRQTGVEQAELEQVSPVALISVAAGMHQEVMLDGGRCAIKAPSSASGPQLQPSFSTARLDVPCNPEAQGNTASPSRCLNVLQINLHAVWPAPCSLVSVQPT